ncbi:MAG: ABC transporter permease [Anaerolineae bacterium]
MRNLRRFLSRRQNLFACTIVGFYILVAILAPQLAPPDDADNPSPFKIVGKSYDTIPHPPSAEAPLGTVPGQMDVYHTLVWGTRSALRFGLIVTLTTACLGVLIGAISGYYGGAVNGLVMRITDAFLTFPAIAGVWLLGQVMMPASPFAEPTPLLKVLFNLKLHPVMLTLILFSWMPYARLINANIIQLKQTEYVQAARAVGARNVRIILRHLLPNALSPAIVLAARDVGGMVILESAFTFVGLGGSTEWGVLLVTGRDYVIGMGGNPLTYWWVFLPATLALVFFGIGWNLLGDGLNTLLNPRTSY